MKLLLVITGSIAAYKALELIRLCVKADIQVDVILTAGAQQFITPMSVSALTGRQCYTQLWSLKDETEMGHIRLAREADVIAVAPASADFMAKLAQGRADDLASTTLLAAEQPLVIAPAMNPAMLSHPATQANIQILTKRGAVMLQGESGSMACGETGEGRFAEPEIVLSFLQARYELQQAGVAIDALAGKHVLVTAGPTREAIDPVRYLSNHSSGKQGYAIATILHAAGAKVTLVSGPTALTRPAGVECINVTSAQQMADAVQGALPADVAICCAAVSDWQVSAVAPEKQKKQAGGFAPDWQKTPDILHGLGHSKQRPQVLVGFAAETEKISEYAQAKCANKQADFIIANDVSGGAVFGQDETDTLICTPESCESLAKGSKMRIACLITQRIWEKLS